MGLPESERLRINQAVNEQYERTGKVEMRHVIQRRCIAAEYAKAVVLEGRGGL